MTTLPVAGYFTNAARTNIEAKDAQDDTLEVIRELLGGNASSAVTIATGSAIPTRATHSIDTESAASSDDLDTLAVTNHPEGRFLLIYAENAGNTVVVKHNSGGSGTILLADAADFTLDEVDKQLLLQRRGTAWVEIYRTYGADTTSQAAFLGVMTNPMTTLSDIIIGGASGVPARLGIGTNGQVLTVVAGVPTWVTPSAGATFPTGFAAPSAIATPPAGWLQMDGSTIGSAASAAVHNDNGLQTLFEALWNNTTQTELAVSPSRGASANADWVADKTIEMPDGRSRAVIGTGASGGLTTRINAAVGGTEDAVNIDHIHTGSVGGTITVSSSGSQHQHKLRTTTDGPTDWDAGANKTILNRDVGTTIYGDDTGGSEQNGTGVATANDGSHGHTASHSLTVTVNSSGVPGANANESPWVALYWMIKT